MPGPIQLSNQAVLCRNPEHTLCVHRDNTSGWKIRLISVSFGSFITSMVCGSAVLRLAMTNPWVSRWYWPTKGRAS